MNKDRVIRFLNIAAAFIAICGDVVATILKHVGAKIFRKE